MILYPPIARIHVKKQDAVSTNRKNPCMKARYRIYQSQEPIFQMRTQCVWNKMHSQTHIHATSGTNTGTQSNSVRTYAFVPRHSGASYLARPHYCCFACAQDSGCLSTCPSHNQWGSGQSSCDQGQQALGQGIDRILSLKKAPSHLPAATASCTPR